MLKYYLVKNYNRVDDIFTYCQYKDLTMAKCRLSPGHIGWVVELDDSNSQHSLFMLNYATCIDSVSRPIEW